jgi:FKBP-type peptidyl-prolyl cis-trans isomerase
MKSQQGFIKLLTLVLLVAIIGLGFWWYMNNNSTGSEVAGDSMSQTLAGGLIVEDVTVGDGTEAVAGKTLSMHYTGTLDDGTVFDSSRTRGTPFEFTLGAGQVISGWDQGIVGMKVGGKRTLTIPPAFGYGANANGPIPANSTLHFEVELISVQ